MLRAVAMILFAAVKFLALLIILPFAALFVLLRWLLYRAVLCYNLRVSGMDSDAIHQLLRLRR